MFGTVLSRVLSPRLLPVTLSVLLLGCGDSPTSGNPAGAGTFSASATGHVNTGFVGAAVSAAAPGSGWGISLGVGHPFIGIQKYGDGRPAVGTYAIVPAVQAVGATETVFFASFAAVAGAGSYTSNSGTLTIHASSPTSVAGSFNFEAQRGAVGDSLIVNVQGTFTTSNTGG